MFLILDYFWDQDLFSPNLLEVNCSMSVGICISQEAFNQVTDADMGTSMKEG